MIIGTALIVITWVVLANLIPVWACVILTIVGACIILFGMLFGIYFFNLDMKLTSKLQPLFIKHYDKMKKDRKI